MKNLKRNIIYRTDDGLAKAAEVSVASNLLQEMKLNSKLTTHLPDGTYDGTIAKINPVTGKSYANIIIDVQNMDKFFKGNLFLNTPNTPLQAIYDVLGDDLNFSELIGTEIRFTVKSNISGSSTFSNLSDLSFVEESPIDTLDKSDETDKPRYISDLDDLLYMDED